MDEKEKKSGSFGPWLMLSAFVIVPVILALYSDLNGAWKVTFIIFGWVVAFVLGFLEMIKDKIKIEDDDDDER